MMTTWRVHSMSLDELPFPFLNLAAFVAFLAAVLYGVFKGLRA
jgi:hypothetical protein